MLNPESYCLFLLKRRLRSRSELSQAMTKRGVKPEEQEETLTRLAGAGLVDDERFAKAWVQSRDRFMPRGESVLRQELMLKGVPRELITQVLAERKEKAAQEDTEQPSELELAKQLLDSKMRSYAHLEPGVRNRRLMALLQRRGFSYEVIRRILNT